MSVHFKITLRLLIVTFLFSLGLSLPEKAAAENQDGTKNILAIGSSEIKEENVAAARMQAIENSLIVAVSNVATELLPLESIMHNFQVFNEVLYNQNEQFIKGYKVLTELLSENNYRVMVEATVSINQLKKLMSTAGIVLDKKVLPKILLLVYEKSSEAPLPKYWWCQDPDVPDVYSANALMETLLSSGFTVIDHHLLRKEIILEENYDKPDLNNQEAMELGHRFQADVIVLGNSMSNITTNIMGESMRSFKATISVRAIRVDTGVEIASTTKTTVTTHTDEIAGNRDALIKTGAAAGQALASQIAAFWQKDIQKGNIIEIIIEGTGNLINFAKFRRVLHDISGVNHLQMKEMTLNQVKIVVDFQGTTEDLAKALMLNASDTIGINIYDISPDYLRIELISG